MEPCKLDNADIIPNDVPSVNAVAGDGNPEIPDDDPPAVVLSNLNAVQQEQFLRLWNKIPAYLRAIHFDFEESLWTADDIEALGDLLCKYAHRFFET